MYSGQSVGKLTISSTIQQQQQQENLLAQQAKIDEMMRKQYEQAAKVDLILISHPHTSVHSHSSLPLYIHLPLFLSTSSCWYFDLFFIHVMWWFNDQFQVPPPPVFTPEARTSVMTNPPRSLIEAQTRVGNSALDWSKVHVVAFHFINWFGLQSLPYCFSSTKWR